jgi:outer membrane protein TolC
MGSLIGTFRNQADSLLMSKSTVNSIKKGENQIVKAAQQLMITYKSLERQKQTLDTMAQMYDEQYQITLNKQAQGMATDLEVLTAQSNQLYAASLSASVASGMLQLKPTLCSLAGWAADADPVIAEIPTVDLSEIDQLNLEADTKKAIGNNTTLISQRTSAKGKTSDGIEARIAMIDEGDQKLTIKMKSLYDDVMAKKTAFEAAQDGYQAALKNREKYKRMQEIGYLNRADFIGTEISYYTEEANYHAADTALRLALETYKWAVKGLTEIE